MFSCGEFIINKDLNIIQMDRELIKYFENCQNIIEVIHEEDRGLFNLYFNDLTRKEMQVRIYCEESIIWTLMSIKKRKDRFHIIFTNINFMKEKIKDFEIKTRYQEEIDSLTDNYKFIYDRQNRVFEELSFKNFYYENQDVNVTFLNELKSIVHPDDYVVFEEIVSCFEKSKDNFENVLRILIENEYTYVKIKALILKLIDEPVKIVGVISNINKEELEKEILRKDAILDPLTGLMNKKESKEYTIKSLEHAKSIKDNSLKALLIIDVDNFKYINDTYGHMFGDTILVEVANMLKEYNSIGRVGRIGGDEFYLFIEKLDSNDELKEICRQICVKFEEIGEKSGIELSSTIGASKFPIDSEVYEILFKQADRGLYRGKKKGKNCYVIYSEEKHGKITLKDDKISNYNEVKEYYLEREVEKNSFLTQIISKVMKSLSINSIQQVLNDIARRYQLDSIEMKIYENNKFTPYLAYSKNEQFRKTIKEYTISSEIEKKYFDLFNQEGVLVLRRAMDVLEEDVELGDLIYNKYDLKAVIQVKTNISKGVIGIISFNMNTKRRLWTNEEIEVVTIIGKILGEFALGKYKMELLSKEKKLDQLTTLDSFYKFIKDMNGKNIDKSFYSLVYLDIVEFKNINQENGYYMGDIILKSIAENIKNILSLDEYACRISDDRFVLLIKKDKQEQRVNDLITNIRLENDKIENLDFSVGIYDITDKDIDIMTCIDRANLARKTRTTNKTSVIFYDQNVEDSIKTKKEYERVMMDALKNKEFKVFYQPQFDIKNEKCVSCEALVRWLKDGEIIFPDSFIPIFEKNKFILELDFYVYEQVLKDIVMLKQEGYKVIPVGVNISRLHIFDEHFVEKLENLVKKYGVNPKMLILEITESAYITRNDKVEQLITNLKEKGFVVVIDDFGSGYTALATLSNVSVDAIKIDKKLVQQKSKESKNDVIIKAILSLANELGMSVITEGVETINQKELLKKIGITLVQGFYYSKAIPIEAFKEKYLDKE